MGTTNSEQLLQLDFSTFQDLGNGAVAKQIQRLIEKAAADMHARPSDKRPRKVRITLEMKPKTHVEDDPIQEREVVVVDGCALRVGFNLVTPDYKSREYDCGFDQDHNILFNPHSPNDHRQRAFPTVVSESQTLPLRQADVKPPDGRSAAVGS
jgi:hypothetical protein